MLLYLTDDFLRAGAAVGPEAIHMNILGIHEREESLMSICLMEAYVRVAIAVLDIDNLITNDIYTRSVAKELLVSRFGIILLCFKELMVEIYIIAFSILQFTCGNQSIDKQSVELACSIEIVGLALVGSIGDVFLSQLLDTPEYGIRAACAQGRMIREMTHQM